jgi:hypothetical protein
LRLSAASGPIIYYIHLLGVLLVNLLTYLFTGVENLFLIKVKQIYSSLY